MLRFPLPSRTARRLRPYQSQAIRDTCANLSRHPIMVCPTGGGKTFTAAELVKQLDCPTLWLAHRKELIEQAATQLADLGLSVGIIKAGREPNPGAPVQVASVQTLVRRDKPVAELIVIDEAHHAAAGSYQSVIAAYPGVPRIGLTATPFRLDGRGLGDMFGALVVAAYPDELVASGVLHAPKVYASKVPDLRGVRVVAGDYALGALADRTNTDELNADVVETWRKHAAGKRTVCFAVDVEHSKAITAAFHAAGIAAEHLDGTMPDEYRAGILRRLKTGETLIVSNCMVLTEGWDLPALECAIIARPTASLNLHLQMIGRVMRASSGKSSALVLDHAGNHHIHGLVTRRLKHSLDGANRVGESEPLGLRQCRKCFLMYPSTEPACPECGFVPQRVERDRPEISGPGELSEFDDTSFDYRRQIWNLIEAEREAAGYKPAWSLFRFEERFGVKPVAVEQDGRRELIDPKHATMDQKRLVYLDLVELGRRLGWKDGAAAHRYRDAFGVWPRGFVEDSRRGGLMERWKQLTGKE